jgi:hypothetical protein
MWQDAFVTMIAIGAIGILARRYLFARAKPSGACPSCASGDSCAKTPAPSASAGVANDVKPLVFVGRR